MDRSLGTPYNLFYFSFFLFFTPFPTPLPLAWLPFRWCFPPSSENKKFPSKGQSTYITLSVVLVDGGADLNQQFSTTTTT
ncbi:hypothetical protein BDV35DRAFT_335896 [Aspergillus flavus]|uniref:Uncharacterized protein n=1 Tax=Aspergillus flavus TaxID=5059 RepID=A0A5N6HCS6_ASPFL|nr:hypothetical protein BDV35DRAFT_335896 [Aspergillus flavus]